MKVQCTQSLLHFFDPQTPRTLHPLSFASAQRIRVNFECLTEAQLDLLHPTSRDTEVGCFPNVSAIRASGTCRLISSSSVFRSEALNLACITFSLSSLRPLLCKHEREYGRSLNKVRCDLIAAKAATRTLRSSRPSREALGDFKGLGFQDSAQEKMVQSALRIRS